MKEIWRFSIRNSAFGLWSSKNKFTLTVQSFFDIWLCDIPFIIWSRMFTLEATVENVLTGMMLGLLVVASADEWGRLEGWEGWGCTGMMPAADESVDGFFFEVSTFIWFGKSSRDIPCNIRVFRVYWRTDTLVSQSLVVIFNVPISLHYLCACNITDS